MCKYIFMIYGRVSLLESEFVVCICVCYIKSEYQQKTHYVSDLSTLGALLHKICIKVLLVLRYQGSGYVDRSTISLSKVAHQMWARSPIQPKKQDSRKSSRGGSYRQQERRAGGWVDKIWRRGCRQYMGVFIK